MLHENQDPNLDTLKYFPHLQKYFGPESLSTEATSHPTFHSMDFLSAFRPSTVTLTPPIRDGPLYERKLRTYNRELQTHKLWNEGAFDGLVSVSSYDPQTYLARCIERIAYSANIVVYNAYREPIIELQNFILTKMPTRPILAPTIHEVRALRWSTLKGRVRPDMVGRGGGGWILGGTRVEESEIETNERGKRRKLKRNGNEMEEIKPETAVEPEGSIG
jgi:hypothetical protein